MADPHGIIDGAESRLDYYVNKSRSSSRGRVTMWIYFTRLTHGARPSPALTRTVVTSQPRTARRAFSAQILRYAGTRNRATAMREMNFRIGTRQSIRYLTRHSGAPRNGVKLAARDANFSRGGTLPSRRVTQSDRRPVARSFRPHRT